MMVYVDALTRRTTPVTVTERRIRAIGSMIRRRAILVPGDCSPETLLALLRQATFKQTQAHGITTRETAWYLSTEVI